MSEIAKKLSISEKTVGSYRSNIKTKLGMKHRSELLPYAIQWIRAEESSEDPVKG